MTRGIDHAIPVCAVHELQDGEAVRIPREQAGTADDIAVFNDNGEYFALNDTCTHARASLSEGWVEDGQVECPLHSGAFCLRTGEALGLPAVTDTVAHRVDVQGGTVWLLPDESQLTDGTGHEPA
ncbi:bifunctional 3-phenylpropionate/cinnamic acid dioxygenase ferredoxin subunit [Kutzneria kofuensis]|uniref:3-phenylpropionate/trans-cinnamate dioxygenase ferredoxin subunit n=1 Tax=Kutzneria kofuensis TaxID=103725 RepID=A0A7W9NGA0_9PSEU|nr:bifunctional 3-phenylpropionate/cinnamic acid dioxygenase ferredoxin subunit [Kutzneria kofuensis]MBB5890961.1 3-phenylpropionate/trans-cinnamate dioxygenase ferredoxin subunit [Kutzneria kofuensis]